MEFQKPRLVASREGEFYVAQFITPEDVKAFRGVVKSQFPGDTQLLSTYTDDGRGSSPVANMIMANVLNGTGWMIADLPQLYDANRTFDNNKVNGQDGGFGVSTRGCYSDARFAIRAKTDGTAHILEQVEDKKLVEEGRKGGLKTPIAFTLFGVEPSVNGTLQGYNFKLTPQARFFRAPQHAPNFTGRFSSLDSDGSPIVTKDGAFTIYNNDNSVVGVFACDDLGLGAWGGNLGNSAGSGRVVKYRALGTEKNLAESLARTRNANLDEAVQAVNTDHTRKLELIAQTRAQVL